MHRNISARLQQFHLLKQNKWLLINRILLFGILLATTSGAATLWTGPRVIKSDADGPDQITGNVALTRGSFQGLYNSVLETGFTHFLSPQDTEWANGTIDNYATLSYTDWNTWAKNINGGPPSTVGIDAVLHLKSDDIYLSIKFLSWSAGGPYSYERSTLAAINQAPTVAIISPTNGTTFLASTNVTIQATANDPDGTVAGVQFYDGSTSLGIVTTLPYSINNPFFPGNHALTAVVTDNQGVATTSAVVNVTVSSTILTNPIPNLIPKGDLMVELQTIGDGMASPLGMTVPDDGSGRMFVYDQAGTVWLVTANGRSATPVLDVRARLNPSAKYSYDERGLLGLAAHPNFAQHPLLYTYTSEPNGAAADFPSSINAGTTNDHQSVIAEWHMNLTSSNLVDVSSRREILRIDKPQSNHNGGTMRFGPDGYLYFSIGDGGNANDTGNGHIPGGNAQSTMSILGKLHRIDVDGNNSANGKYGIPLDNPFNGITGLREIFCYGMRNPFNFSFDRLTGQIYEGDVGQNKVEEINILTKGGNYGWNIKEGTFWFDGLGNDVTAPVRPVPSGLIDPIAEYDHDDGSAIIGGFIYRGSSIPALQGRYVFADWGGFTQPSGRLLYLDTGNTVKEFRLGLADRPLGLWVKGFGEGPDGELYIFGSRVVGPAGNTGKMLKLTSAPNPIHIVSTTPANGISLTTTWTGGQGPYVLQQKNALTDPTWMNKGIATQPNITHNIDGLAGFYRVLDAAHQPAIPLSVQLTGAGERPTPLNNGGLGVGLLSLEGNTLSFDLRYSGLSGIATAAHIHGPASTATSAGVLIDLAPFNGGAFSNNGSLSGTIVVSDAQKAMIIAGQTYINFHTADNPGGEIRGQIAPVLMQVALGGANQRPVPVTTSASGLGVLSLVNNQLTFNITYKGLSSAALAAHIHGPSSLSGTAGVLIDLAPYNGGSFGTNGALAGTVTLTPNQLAALINSQTYINFHTAANPNGEIRGQIVPQSTAIPLTAALTGLSEKPTPLTNSATGQGFFALEGNTLTFSLSYGNLSGIATAAHIHGPTNSSANANVIVDLAPFNGGGFGSSGTVSGSIILPPDQRDMVRNGKAYVNFQTAANPGGEIRGQIAPVLMRTYLSGAEERPTPVFTAGTSLGTFALVLNQLTMNLSYTGLSGTVTDAHIHGPAGITQTAGVLVGLSAYNGGSFGTFGSISGSVTLTPSQLGNLVDQLTYANMHTANFPAGEIRGQILP